MKNQRSLQGRNRQIIEHIFKHEKEIRAAVKMARDEKPQGNSGGNAISDPTANTAIRNLTEITTVTLSDGYDVHYPERWLTVIDETYNHCNSTEREAIKLRFKCGAYYKRIYDKLHISQGHYYILVNKSLSFAEAAACQLGLIKVI